MYGGMKHLSNKQKQIRLAFQVGLALLYLGSGCTADKVTPIVIEDCPMPQPTYDGAIKAIIDRSCAYSGCHLDSAPGRYDSYEGLKSILDGGKFKSRVIDVKDDPNAGMPPDYSPEGRPENLTEEELNMIQCWLEADYPKN